MSILGGLSCALTIAKFDSSHLLMLRRDGTLKYRARLL